MTDYTSQVRAACQWLLVVVYAGTLTATTLSRTLAILAAGVGREGAAVTATISTFTAAGLTIVAHHQVRDTRVSPDSSR